MFLLVLLACLPNASIGYVVSVTDGDTIRLLDGQRIRLEGIDAPEKKQPHGQASKAALSKLTHNRYVLVLWRKQDRYGRTLGHVITPTWVNYELIRQGNAWHFRRYNQSRHLAEAEQVARDGKRGLWAGESVSPWEWRKR